MANSYAFQFHCEQADLESLMYKIDQQGFDGVYESENASSFIAYANSEILDIQFLNTFFQNLQKELRFEFSSEIIEDRNWNALWESQFPPVTINDQVYIRAPFHESKPHIPIELIIEPKMSFGTGHHATTSMVVELMLSLDLTDKKVLDAGCGTGILGILAEKRGAKIVKGFDVEKWAFENAQENAERNHCVNTEFYQGDANGLPYKVPAYDIVLANITKNILKEDIGVYLNYLTANGILIISGFLESDISEMHTFCGELGLKQEKVLIKNNWAAVQFNYQGGN